MKLAEGSVKYNGDTILMRVVNVHHGRGFAGEIGGRDSGGLLGGEGEGGSGIGGLWLKLAM